MSLQQALAVIRSAHATSPRKTLAFGDDDDQGENGPYLVQLKAPVTTARNLGVLQWRVEGGNWESGERREPDRDRRERKWVWDLPVLHASRGSVIYIRGGDPGIPFKSARLFVMDDIEGPGGIFPFRVVLEEESPSDIDVSRPPYVIQGHLEVVSV